MQKNEMLVWHRLLVTYENDEACYDLTSTPSDEEEVLLQTIYGIKIDTFYADADGMYFETYNPQEVIAWARLPLGFIK